MFEKKSVFVTLDSILSAYLLFGGLSQNYMWGHLVRVREIHDFRHGGAICIQKQTKQVFSENSDNFQFFLVSNVQIGQ